MYLYHLTKAFFCQINTLLNLYMSATAQLETFYYYRVSLENNYLAVPRPTLALNDMLNKKNCMLKMMPLHPNLGTDDRVVFKLCL